MYSFKCSVRCGHKSWVQETKFSILTVLERLNHLTPVGGRMGGMPRQWAQSSRWGAKREGQRQIDIRDREAETETETRTETEVEREEGRQKQRDRARERDQAPVSGVFFLGPRVKCTSKGMQGFH